MFEGPALTQWVYFFMKSTEISLHVFLHQKVLVESKTIMIFSLNKVYGQLQLVILCCPITKSDTYVLHMLHSQSDVSSALNRSSHYKMHDS